MTNFAPVAPLGILKQLAEANRLGNYQLLIAPIVVDRENEYRAFFEAHDDQQIIMDNGVIELGYPLDPFQLWRAVRIVGANVVVMPDTIDDWKMTVKQVRQALPAYRHWDEYTDTMGVVQGTNFEECIKCATQLVEAGVDWLGVPRGLTPHLGSRIRLVKTLGETFGLPMHVLGFSEDIRDDILAATSHHLVVGMDAATPVWLGFPTETVDVSTFEAPEVLSYGRWMPPSPPEVANFGRRPKDFWQTDHVKRMEPVAYNIDRVRHWILQAEAAEPSNGLNDVQNAHTNEEGPAEAVGQ